MLDLPGKVAIVTGAGSVGPGWGNGKATAVLLARQGAKVFAIDRELAAAEETRGIIEQEKGKGTAIAHRCDMTATEQVEAAVAACLTAFGRVDILINNVGGSAPGDPVAMAEAVWDAQLDHNLKTAFLGCKHVLPHMVTQGGGAIVNISSIAGMRSDSDRAHVAYAATKSGIIGFTRSVAMAYVKKNIRCNAVVPGIMFTPLVEHRLVGQIGGNDAAKLIAKRHAQVPMGQMGTGWDVAHAVLFLVSDEARHITATQLVVDGGVTAGSP
jgi:NAD(P)-dependent dehydrogenase (short-subunit alcohol dehydrogenase family)